MNFEQFTVVPSFLVGGGFAFILSFLLDKRAEAKYSPEAFVAETSDDVARLQSELATAKEEVDKIADLHSYTRQLEAKLQAFESASTEGGNDEYEMRVRVLEQQLGEKAAVEAKLAAMQQAYSDLENEFEMYQAMAPAVTAVGMSAGVAGAPIATPATEEPEESGELAVGGSVRVDELEGVSVESDTEPGSQADVAALDEQSKNSKSFEYKDDFTAVEEVTASPMVNPVEMEVVQNDNPISVPVHVQPMVATGGSAAAALMDPIEDRPALRVEVPSQVAVSDNRDPLEEIEGIGPVYQQKLYEAGINTFAQLAAASPSRITEIIEPQNWQHIDVMKWRREAALHAAGEKP